MATAQGTSSMDVQNMAQSDMEAENASIVNTDGMEDSNSQSRIRKPTERGLEFRIDMSVKQFLQMEKALKRQIDMVEEIVIISNDLQEIQCAFKELFSRRRELTKILDNLEDIMGEIYVKQYKERAGTLFRTVTDMAKSSETTIKDLRMSDSSDKGSVATVMNLPARQGQGMSEIAANLYTSQVQHGLSFGANSNQTSRSLPPGVGNGADGIFDKMGRYFGSMPVPQQGNMHGNDLLDLNFEPRVNKIDNIGSSASVAAHISNSSSVMSERFMADVLLTNQKLVSGQRMQNYGLKTFNGEVINFPTWERSFDALLDNCVATANEKLNLLEKHLGEKPLNMVKGLLIDRTEGSYLMARNRLSKRYGNDSLLFKVFMEKLEGWPQIGNRDPDGISRFGDFLYQLLALKNKIHAFNILDYAMESIKIIRKLPSYMVNIWRTVVQNYRLKFGENAYPTFKDVVAFICDQADRENIPELNYGLENNFHSPGHEHEKRRGKYGNANSKNKSVSFATNGNTVIDKSDKVCCMYCDNKGGCSGEAAHNIDECENFLKLTRLERKDFLVANRVCFGCGVSSDHIARLCRNRRKCKVCGKLHLTCLHVDIGDGSKVFSKCTNVCSLKGQAGGTDNSMIVPVWVQSEEAPGKSIACYAVLDDQSNTCFITDEVKQKLGIKGFDTNLNLSTMLECNSMVKCEKVINLKVSSFDKSSSVKINNAYTRKDIPASSTQIPKPEVAKTWKHLRVISNYIRPYNDDLPIGMLIGSNVPAAVRPRDVVVGKENEPYAQKSLLGWGIIGTVCKDAANDAKFCNRIMATECTGEIVPARFCISTKGKEILDSSKVLGILEQDFVEKSDKGPLSVEDRRFLDILSKGISRRDDGHLEMPLPFKSDNTEVPFNCDVAVKRVLGLKRRLNKDSSLKNDYISFMKDLVENYAEKVPANRSLACDGRINYIPHSFVYHPTKGKIRVVFDCSANYGGVCINDFLLQGPDLLNGMVGILSRFRMERVAFSCDIKSMFHQFFVRSEDRDFLRFLWWEHHDLDKGSLVEYRMKVHIFGAKSSPGCANFGLKWCADMGEKFYGKKTADFIRSNFYVDDGLLSVSTVDKAKEIIKNTTFLCKDFGLTLHKFVSNCNEVLDNDTNDVSKVFSESADRTLGILWFSKKDFFGFKIDLKDKPATRRGILSTVSGVYDPLGFVAPVILMGKQILQQLCAFKMDWDCTIPADLLDKWVRWKAEIVKLNFLEIKRCLKPENFGDILATEIHYFSDGSKVGYGQSTYVRFVSKMGKSYCSFLIGKARVAPLHQQTIPRLELVAALLSARISRLVNNEMGFNNAKEYFWTDSQIVLGYIKNEARRFQSFVANRIQEIRDLTDPDSWYYVESKDPSDDASRRISASKLTIGCRWLNGPAFLWRDGVLSSWNMDEYGYDPSEEDKDEIAKEMRKVVVMATSAKPARNGFNLELLEKFSKWYRCKRFICNCIYLKEKLLGQCKSKSFKEFQTCTRILDAERILVKAIQQRHFGEEIDVIRNLERSSAREVKAKLSKNCKLWRLNPYLDEFGVLRVGGRVKKSSLSLCSMHPVILPQKERLVELLVMDFHEECNHMGRGMTHNTVRQNGFWIINGSSIVSKLIHNCVTCRRMRKGLETQKMGDLPRDRMAEEPPFTYCGMDLFGPFEVKERRSTLKRYGVIYTCLSSRAVHLEVVNSLETDAFINSLRRFMARRGPVKMLRSDCGTNFIGARNEFDREEKKMDEQRIKDYLSRKQCDGIRFEFNVPHSSHMGGAWERQIRTVRSALEVVLRENSLHMDDDVLRTLFCEVENIVNSRPLSTLGINDGDLPEPLTPNHILTMKAKVLIPPPGNFQRPDLYLRNRWRRVQHLCEVFWSRWRMEFLQTMQARNKWISPKRNLTKEDIVLLKENDIKRNEWKMAIVCDAYKGEDGLVRKVKLKMGSKDLDARSVAFIERPVHSVVVLMESDEGRFPDEEP